MYITNIFSISLQRMHAYAIPTRKIKRFPNNTRVKFNSLEIAAEHYPQHPMTLTLPHAISVSLRIAKETTHVRKCSRYNPNPDPNPNQMKQYMPIRALHLPTHSLATNSKLSFSMRTHIKLQVNL